MSDVEFCGFYDRDKGKCQIREKVKQKLAGVDATKQALVTALRRLTYAPPSNAIVKGQEWNCDRAHFSTTDPSVLQKQQRCNMIGTSRALQSF